jgi:ABC-2 type transport system ATP-binding protein
MDEAERCQRVALIAGGRLIAYDRPDVIRRQVPGELLECRPSDFRRAKHLVAGLPGVLEVQTYGPSLHLFVDEAERRMPEIEAALRAAGITCQGMRQIIPQMEEAFISLLRRRREAERG